MKRMTIWMSICVLLLTIIGYAIFRPTRARAGGEERAKGDTKDVAQGEAQKAKLETKGLKLAPVTSGESWEVVTASGTVIPDLGHSVKIGPRVAGKVAAVYVQVGDSVHVGRVLATISSTEVAQARAAYRQAAAKVQAARANAQRQHQLASLGAFGKRPAEEAQAEALATQGELAEAIANLAKAQSELAQSSAKLTRTRELYLDEIVARQDVETAEADHQRDLAEMEVAQAKLTQAEAQVSIAKNYKAREEKVLGGNLLAAKEVQAAQVELTAAELDLMAAGEALRVLGASPASASDTVAVTSPIAGRVVTQTVTLGEMVEPSSVLFTVMDLDEVQIMADVYEKDLAKVRTGQSVEVRVEAFSDRVFAGTVRSVSDALDPQSRTAKLRCVISNADRALKPEMFATVSVITARRAGAIFVPKQAALDDGGKKVIFVACMDCDEDHRAGKSVCGRFDKVEVKLGPAHGDRVEVRGEIEPSQEVVTEGAYQLKTALGSGKLDAGCADD